MSSLARVCLMLCLPAALTAADSALRLPVLTEPIRPAVGRWSFELLPKTFQKNPQLEITAVTDLTPYGRSLPTASPEHPVYYTGFNTGFKERGDIIASQHPPADTYLARVLEHALTTNGYLAASREHPATLTLFFHWGAHSAMDREMSMMFPDLAVRQRLERAMLVGGKRYRETMLQRMQFGDGPRDHTLKLEYLDTQSGSDLYFVVISAYDRAALARGEHRLAWRTNLTVGAVGVAMADSMPALILSGAPYFGREMAEPEVILRRVKPGVVEYGPARVVESDVPFPRSN